MSREEGIPWGKCLNCGDNFIKKTPDQEFCKPSCGEEWIKKKRFLGTRRRQIRRSKHEEGEQARLV